MTYSARGAGGLTVAALALLPHLALGGGSTALPYAELERVSLAMQHLSEEPELVGAKLTPETSASGYTANTSAEECAECHMSEYIQWDEGQTGHMFPVDVYTGGQRTGAMHRLAFLDDTFHHHFVENGSKDACLRCHVPESVYTTEMSRGTTAPASRTLASENAIEGITCVSCHLDTQGRIRGEHDYTAAEADHAVLADESMYDGHSMCESCHGDIFWGALNDTSRQWEEQAKSTGLTCVDCHMVSLDDNTTPSHAFPGAHSGAMTQAAYGFAPPQTATPGEPYTVQFCNQFAGHNMPSGDQFRAYTVHLTVQGANGAGFDDEIWISPVFKTPAMVEVVDYKRVDPIPFLTCRGLEFPELRAGTYTVSYEIGFWLLKPVKLRVLIPPWADDIQSDGEVFRTLQSGTYTLRVGD